MLTIHVGNHFNNEFVPPCHIDYIINDDGRKLTAKSLRVTYAILLTVTGES